MTACLINCLARGSTTARQSKSFLNQEEAKAERDFLQLCTSMKDIIGVHHTGAPLIYPLWDKNVSLCPECRDSGCVFGSDAPHHFDVSSDSEFQEEGDHTTACMRSLFREFKIRHETIQRNQLRHLGFLLQQPEYSQGIAAFVERSSSFDVAALFQLINGQLFSLPGIRGQADQIIAGEDLLARFLHDVSQFAARWCIAGFITWELPLIQVPLEGFPAEVVALLRGPGAIVSHAPVFLNLPSTQQPQHRVQEADQLGFPLDLTRRILAEGSLTSREETLFRMFILETAVSQRIPKGKRGLVVRMLEAFQQHFGCGERFLHKLRSAYVPKA